jgi:integral membrane protein
MKLFRWVALIEGVSTLALFLVAMPLKYGFGNAALIRPLGMFHGGAFVAYLAVMLIAFALHGMRPMGWLRGFVASLFPFGTFLNDAWIQREITAKMAPRQTA